MNTLPFFYTPDIARNTALPAEEAAHAVRVLRLCRGDEIALTDGKGALYRARITLAASGRCEVEIVERREPDLPETVGVHIAVSPTKSADRMEWFVEKAAEIGIQAITLLECRHSERREMKTVRLEKALTGAVKQSRQATLPLLTGMTPFRTFIRQPFDGHKFIAHCDDTVAARLLLAKACPPGENALILVGPEGGFSSEEVADAMAAGFTPVSLSPHRLRTETAALIACHTVRVLNAGI
jgi:16S rRNA (uracil1498-N3)-methyltransferase